MTASSIIIDLKEAKFGPLQLAVVNEDSILTTLVTISEVDFSSAIKPNELAVREAIKDITGRTFVMPSRTKTMFWYNGADPTDLVDALEAENIIDLGPAEAARRSITRFLNNFTAP